MGYDFSGYATRNNIRCSDGRTIMKDAFADQDGQKVPLVYQHNHSDIDNVLGHAVLENRNDGVYCYGTFNNTPMGRDAKELVKHGDITALSIYANHLTERNKNVMHGNIREVSLVLAGANPGAYIDNVTLQHSDGTQDLLDDEAVIYSGEEIVLEHGDEESEDDMQHADNFKMPTTQSEKPTGSSGKTVQQVWDTFTDKQKDAVYALIGAAIGGSEESVAQSDISHADDEGSGDSSGSGETVQDVFDALNEEQKNVAYALIGLAVEQGDSDTEDSDGENNNSASHSEEEGDIMHMNAFEQAGAEDEAPVLSHDDMKEFLAEAKDYGSFRDYSEKWMQHTGQTYGIENIEVLFPDARQVGDEPYLYKRDTDWVDVVLNGTRHTPFARIKTSYADLTEDEARAKGFTLDRKKNKRKMDEVFKVYKRVTTPQTIYKKQRLDRDDEIDITDFNVVNFLWNEMKVMIREEMARDILIGDGRAASAEDHVNTENVRPIVGDDDLYVIYNKGKDPATDPTAFVDRARKAKVGYMGSGMPTLFLSPSLHGELMVQRDKVGRRLYDTDASLAAAMGVSAIVEVPVLEGFYYGETGSEEYVDAVMVNLRDYTIGTDRGGELTQFSDFDIDYNQHKYLIEARLSGALTMPKSAIVLTHPKA
jgi:HK97 family phage prohead protease|nr:MAG TPA: major capsid protein [Caudoviricetes sp.]